MIEKLTRLNIANLTLNDYDKLVADESIKKDMENFAKYERVRARRKDLFEIKSEVFFNQKNKQHVNYYDLNLLKQVAENYDKICVYSDEKLKKVRSDYETGLCSVEKLEDAEYETYLYNSRKENAHFKYDKEIERLKSDNIDTEIPQGKIDLLKEQLRTSPYINKYIKELQSKKEEYKEGKATEVDILDAKIKLLKKVNNVVEVGTIEYVKQTIF